MDIRPSLLPLVLLFVLWLHFSIKINKALASVASRLKLRRAKAHASVRLKDSPRPTQSEIEETDEKLAQKELQVKELNERLAVLEGQLKIKIHQEEAMGGVVGGDWIDQGKDLEEFFESTAARKSNLFMFGDAYRHGDGKFRTEIGKAWALEIVSRRKKH
ncbi:hypothetical protein Cgig2_023848 [Carnegiea gigantea]|uniref:Uncharacterized protein n=1 Tax=Carnegiea gigantea TaxID=171969 RepID=A0A9Q1K8G3_9CARY|nr:hypothetical protein Cgig2_023848 [Carnegiea gigantea]